LSLQSSVTHAAVSSPRMGLTTISWMTGVEIRWFWEPVSIQQLFFANLLTLFLVSAAEIDVDTLRALKLRTFADPDTTFVKELLDTPIGIASLEFNSRIGVPLDVWVTITTAYIQCPTCQLCRSFPAYHAHLRDGMECLDLGEGVATLASGKGKGRESQAADVFQDE
jgi:hypothetical protein